MKRLSKNRECPLKDAEAFSLIELLCIVAVISVLMALLTPAFASMTASTGRKGAVTTVMNTLEQARAAALENGRDVMVLLWKREGDERDSLLVMRKNDDGSDWEQLSRWIKLPRGVIFHGEDSTSEILNNSPALAGVRSSLNKLPGNPQETNLGAVQFSASGAVQSPKSAQGLRVALTEGQRGTSGNEAAITKQKQNQNAAGGGFEVISIARYTGRTTLDITTLR